jgi:hypothetical protein
MPQTNLPSRGSASITFIAAVGATHQSKPQQRRDIATPGR